MPLEESCSPDSFDRNVAVEIDAGKAPDEAVAIAHDVMRRACRAAGKPVPKKAKSREYLEAALERAKEILPAWMSAMIHQAALPRAGGRARARMRKVQAAARAAGNPALLKSVSVEQHAEIEALLVDYGLAHIETKPVAGQVRKGLANGMEDAGAHAHGLDRLAGKTHVDGAHRHWFLVPGTGELVATYEDGAHEHSIEGGIKGGEHSHHVEIAGASLQTSIDGAHKHEEQIETTGFGGSHQHELRLPDGTTTKSFTVAEYVKKYGLEKTSGPPMPPSSAIATALSRVRFLEEEVQYLREMPPSIGDAVTQLAAGNKPVCSYPVAMEVTAKTVDGVDVDFADGDGGFSVACALDVSEGDVVDVLGDTVTQKSARLLPMTVAEADDLVTLCETLKIMGREVPWRGPDEGAKVIFLAAAPNELEAARGEAIVGADAEIFRKHYIEPLGLSRSDVTLGFISPHWLPDPVDTKRIAPWLVKTKEQIARHPGARVVALGKAAHDALSEIGQVVDEWVPHPAVVRKSGDTGQVARKLTLKRLALDAKKSIDDIGDNQPERKVDLLADADGGAALRTVTLKADRPELQIVYGVVLDPNMVDAHNDWAPPADIQSTAHGYLEKSRVVGLEHEKRVQAKVVESFVEQYPTQKDYRAAMEGRPHRVTRRKFGNDSLMSGAWVLGVKLEDHEWNDYKQGKITGFSMGGFSAKSPMLKSEMPKITVVDLVEK